MCHDRKFEHPACQCCVCGCVGGGGGGCLCGGVGVRACMLPLQQHAVSAGCPSKCRVSWPLYSMYSA